MATVGSFQEKKIDWNYGTEEQSVVLVYFVINIYDNLIFFELKCSNFKFLGGFYDSALQFWMILVVWRKRQ